MSTTALVRSSSSSNSLVAPNSQSKSFSPATTSAVPPSQLVSRAQQTPPLSRARTPQQRPSPAPSTPGRWQHPRIDEVTRRQNKTNFDKSNVRAISYNTFLILASIYLPTLIPTPWLRATHPYPTYTLLTLRLFLLFNIALALTPLFRKNDPCEDIPLTPAQRQLLGLPPMSRPATPQEQQQYMTPPRYSRSATPKGDSSSSSLRVGSPLSGRGTPTQRGASGSPVTPSGLRSMSGNSAERRRLSYGARASSSELDAGGSMMGTTPTKINNRASVGLNSKWLYEKGRGSPGAVGVGVSGAGWGTGSVFS